MAATRRAVLVAAGLLGVAAVSPAAAEPSKAEYVKILRARVEELQRLLDECRSSH